ncbi:uncharacterized protein LOC131859145 [Cryptomeria japonica]|uniref:uncharacterized protein LOC131859145 n=1 Tax=Cryptomeria japonica TaxID=3369 RepID=UPI0027D9D39E|nr:uncharacterized protein LOC131859145 [Cryptomeria japonica]
MKWGLDFIGVINPPSSAGHKWVLTATDYFMKWTEVMALKEATKFVVLNFYEDLIAIFGVLDSIISDNGLAFASFKISDWVVKKGIYLNTSSNYYPQGNGQAESTNKNLIRIIKKTTEGNQRIWLTQLKSALWANRITPKISTGQSSFMLVYGKKARLPISFEFPALDLANQLDTLEEGPSTIRLAQLFELEETRNEAMKKIEQHQAQMKRSFDKKASPRNFQGAQRFSALQAGWQHGANPSQWDSPQALLLRYDQQPVYTRRSVTVVSYHSSVK